MASNTTHKTPITRYYIDTRSLVPQRANPRAINEGPVDLPLLDTLPSETRDSITRYLRAEDKFMSLASALLKYTFVHRTARIPWSKVSISRTPKPHGRPFWDPPSNWHGNGFEGLEFNVSHQAGLVILAGCRTPGRPNESLGVSPSGVNVTPDPAAGTSGQIRIGVDVACTKEPRRTPDMSTQRKLEEWVDTFAEMFSERDRTEMKHRDIPEALAEEGEAALLEAKARRFYTCWALKEAYIKMVGEGLLADWLRRLEFVDVVSPEPGRRLTAAESGMKVMFEGRDVTESVVVEMEGFQETFLFMVITRGLVDEGDSPQKKWVRLDIDRDVRPCAEETCSCLEV